MREPTIFDLLTLGSLGIGVVLQGLVALTLLAALASGLRDSDLARGFGSACVLVGALTFPVALPVEGPLGALGLGGASAGWGALGLLAPRLLAPRGAVRAELLRVAAVWPCLVAGTGVYVFLAVRANVDRETLRALGGMSRVLLSAAFAAGLALVAWRVAVARRADEAPGGPAA